MRILFAGLATVAAGSLLGCTLDFQSCGEDGVICGGSESVCICRTGKCAEPDEDCASGLHYVGGRCVPEDEARTAVDSTAARPGVCRGTADGGDGARDETAADARADGDGGDG